MDQEPVVAVAKKTTRRKRKKTLLERCFSQSGRWVSGDSRRLNSKAGESPSKGGAPPGNQNALRHGRSTKARIAHGLRQDPVLAQARALTDLVQESKRFWPPEIKELIRREDERLRQKQLRVDRVLAAIAD